MSSPQAYGACLPDQVDRIAKLFKAHIDLISEVREIYRERVTIERDYATKLHALAKKASEKKAKLEASVVLGDEPTKAWDESAIRSNTLNRGYAEVIGSLVNTAQDHNTLADSFVSEVVDVLRAMERKHDDLKKKELQYFEKLLSERDRTNSERLKSKQKYDEECVEYDSQRQKQEKTTDDRHAERVAKQLEQQRNEMLNCKNVYIISTAVANNVKVKFYEQDLPSLEDRFQDLQSNLTQRFVALLFHAQALQLSNLDSCKGHIAAIESALEQVDPSSDQAIFISYNIRPFDAPPDFDFEPCATHYDTAEMNVDSTPKTILQNKLSKCREKLQELTPIMGTKRKDFDHCAKLFKNSLSRSSVDDISENYVEASHQLTLMATSQCILDTEESTILAALGDDEGGQQPHSFKSTSFSIPSQCGYCKTSIWGLSKQGKTCTLCGMSVHSKCELKVPAECRRSRGKTNPTGTSTTTRSESRGAPKASISKLPTASSFVKAAETQEHPVATVVFDFTAGSTFELTVSEGESVHVIEEDDGSGWIKVAGSKGGKGLVPASYIQFTDETSPPNVQVTSHPQGSAKRVRGLYEYDAQGPDEISVKVGEYIELSSGPNGGQNYGDGWWEGINAKGQKGIFPSNYVELVL